MSNGEGDSGTNHINDLYKRVGLVETELAALSTDVAHVRTDISNISSDLGKISTQLAQQNKPNWQVLLSSVVVILMILGMFGSGYIRDLNRVEAQSIVNTHTLTESYKTLGVTASQLNSNTKEIDRLRSREDEVNAKENRQFIDLNTKHIESIIEQQSNK